MKQVFTRLLCVIFLGGSALYGQFGWSNTGFGSGWESPTGVATDGLGNSYVTGTFSGPTITVTGTTGPQVLTGYGMDDIFIAKYNPDGLLEWAKTYGGSAHDRVWNISSGIDGTVAIVGYFDSPAITFGAAGTYTQSGGGDAYLLTFDAAGTELWARQLQGDHRDEYKDVHVTDAAIFTTGLLVSTGVQIGSYNLSNSGSSVTTDILLVRYDLQGNVDWAASYGNALALEGGFGLTTNGDRLFVVGGYSTTGYSFCLPNNNCVTANTGGTDMWLASFDANDPANCDWVRQANGHSQELFDAIAVDRAGGVYIHGRSQSSTMTSPSFPTQNNPGSLDADVYLIKFLEDGTFDWIDKNLLGGFEWGNAIAADGCGNIWIGGTFGGSSVQFGGFILNATTTHANHYLVRYDQDGTVLDAEHIPSSGLIGSNSRGIAIAPDLEPIVVGDFVTTVTFPGGTSPNSYTAPGGPNREFCIVKGDFQPDTDWQQTSSNTIGTARGVDIAQDSRGDIYVTGTFEEETTLGSGTNQVVLVGSGMFAAKYSSCGNLIWAARTQNGVAGSEGIAIDEKNGWVYVCGPLTSGSESFESGESPLGVSCGLSQTASASSYAARYQMSDGCLDHVQTFGGDYKTRSVATDPDGNIFLAAEFTLGGVKRVAAAKFEDNWSFQWSHWSTGPVGSNCHASDIAVHHNAQTGDNTVYMTGNFFREFEIGGIPLTNPSIYDAFVIQFRDPSGGGSTVNWAVKGFADAYSHGESITVDTAGNAYATGTFSGNMLPAFGGFNLTGLGSSSGFVARFDAGAGGAPAWANTVTAEGGVVATGISGDVQGLYLTGYWHGGPGPGPLMFPASQGIPAVAFAGNAGNASMYNSYVARYNYDNTNIDTWGTSTEGQELHRSRGVVSNNSAYVFTTGQYTGTMDLPPYNAGTQGQLVSTAGVNDVFVIRTEKSGGDFLKAAPATPEAGLVSDEARPVVFPNPSRDVFRVRFKQGAEAQLAVYDLKGQRLLQRNTSGGNAELDLGKQPAGVYLLRWVRGDQHGTQKLLRR